MESKPQLELVWPESRRNDPPAVRPYTGYSIRTYRAGDEEQFFGLMALAGWPDWDRKRLQPWVDRLLPEGWFMAVVENTDKVVASAMALRSKTFVGAGELGWLAADPAHSGRRLGHAASAAVTERFLAEGSWPIHLYTEDFRYAALKIYLHLGYEPVHLDSDASERWRAMCSKIDWPFEPELWKGWDTIV